MSLRDSPPLRPRAKKIEGEGEWLSGDDLIRIRNNVSNYFIDNWVFLNKLDAAGGVAQVVRAYGSYP